jgi:hypothetical protein
MNLPWHGGHLTSFCREPLPMVMALIRAAVWRLEGRRTGRRLPERPPRRDPHTAQRRRYYLLAIADQHRTGLDLGPPVAVRPLRRRPGRPHLGHGHRRGHPAPCGLIAGDTVVGIRTGPVTDILQRTLGLGQASRVHGLRPWRSRPYDPAHHRPDRGRRRDTSTSPDGESAPTVCRPHAAPRPSVASLCLSSACRILCGRTS